MTWLEWLEAKEDAALAVLRSRAVLRIGTLLVTVAAIVRYVTPAGTPWHEHAGLVCGVGAALGITSSMVPK